MGKRIMMRNLEIKETVGKMSGQDRNLARFTPEADVEIVNVWASKLMPNGSEIEISRGELIRSCYYWRHAERSAKRLLPDVETSDNRRLTSIDVVDGGLELTVWIVNQDVSDVYRLEPDGGILYQLATFKMFVNVAGKVWTLLVRREARTAVYMISVHRANQDFIFDSSLREMGLISVNEKEYHLKKGEPTERCLLNYPDGLTIAQVVVNRTDPSSFDDAGHPVCLISHPRYHREDLADVVSIKTENPEFAEYLRRGMALQSAWRLKTLKADVHRVKFCFVNGVTGETAEAELPLYTSDEAHFGDDAQSFTASLQVVGVDDTGRVIWVRLQGDGEIWGFSEYKCVIETLEMTPVPTRRWKHEEQEWRHSVRRWLRMFRKGRKVRAA